MAAIHRDGPDITFGSSDAVKVAVERVVVVTLPMHVQSGGTDPDPLLHTGNAGAMHVTLQV
jgi:hypothetical protein